MGLYIHIPFCRSKCLYCDFCSFPKPDPPLMEAYVDELIRRMEERGLRTSKQELSGVFHGTRHGRKIDYMIDLIEEIVEEVGGERA
jgi:coproporphyrinogen III oxidase-like Fe-S oxidoreductase